MVKLFLGSILVALTCSQLYADLVVIVHPNNPASDLSPKQLQRIFLGRMPLFPHSDQEIRAVDLPDDDPAFIQFYQQVIELEGTQLKRYRAYYLFSGRGKLPLVLGSSKEVIRQVAESPRAIGYVLDSELDDSVKVILTLPSPD